MGPGAALPAPYFTGMKFFVHFLIRGANPGGPATNLASTRCKLKGFPRVWGGTASCLNWGVSGKEQNTPCPLDQGDQRQPMEWR